MGIVTGTVLAGYLVMALDLPSVTGGQHPPRLVITWWILAIPVTLGLVARIAVAVAAIGHRGEALGPLIRAN